MTPTKKETAFSAEYLLLPLEAGPSYDLMCTKNNHPLSKSKFNRIKIEIDSHGNKIFDLR